MVKSLIVDDKLENLYMLQVLLQGNGHTVSTAANGAEALEKARQEPPDLIISDILMPVMDGFSFCIECKKDPKIKDIPFIFYTATYTDPKDEKFALSIGADMFILKPVEPQDMIEKINLVFERHKASLKQDAVINAQHQPAFLKEYNEILIHKLEDKMSELDEANKVLQTSESRYRNLFNRVPVGLFRMTPEGNILDANPALLHMFGNLVSETGQNINIMETFVDRDDFIGFSGKLKEQDVVDGFETRWKRADGSIIWVELAARRIEDEIGRIFYEGNANDITDKKKASMELLMAYDSTLEGWIRALDLRDNETEGHSMRVASMTVVLAREFQIPEDDLIHIRRGALLHDIGKMAIPDKILYKTGPLSQEDWELMHMHPAYAYDMLSQIDFLRPALDIPYCHHEKWDGSGYPRGLMGDEIPLAARLFAVVDVWDALRSDRPYRNAWPADKVLAHMKEQSGKHFDPKILPVFFSVFNLK